MSFFAIQWARSHSSKSANQLSWIFHFSLNYCFLPFEFVPLVQPQYFFPLNAINWGISPKLKILTGGLPVENIQYILPIYSLSANLVFLFPLMSLDVNLFQLLSQSYFYLITHLESWRISFPFLISKITPFDPTFHRPSASGFWVVVRFYLLLCRVCQDKDTYLTVQWHVDVIGRVFRAALLLSSPIRGFPEACPHYCPQLPCLSGNAKPDDTRSELQ